MSKKGRLQLNRDIYYILVKTLTLCLDVEEQVREAEGITRCLEAERIKVGEKPQTDTECLR